MEGGVDKPRAGATLLAAMVVAASLAACGGALPVAPVASTSTTTGAGPTLRLEPSPDGPILADSAGYTLYDFVPDTPTRSACVSVECVALWPPLIVTSAPTVGAGLQQSLVGTIVRPGGARQVKYGGHPLYRWYNDTRPGMVTGQALLNKGGYWYVITATGKQVTTPFSVPG
jgi:predicted lipoprotein with Yx(FWY)xxD motif